MNHLQSLTNPQLLDAIHQLVSRERELVTHLLEHLREVERRRLFAELGYSSTSTARASFDTARPPRNSESMP